MDSLARGISSFSPLVALFPGPAQLSVASSTFARGESLGTRLVHWDLYNKGSLMPLLLQKCMPFTEVSEGMSVCMISTPVMLNGKKKKYFCVNDVLLMFVV